VIANIEKENKEMIENIGDTEKDIYKIERMKKKFVSQKINLK
jgi:hypothetical protein